MNIYYKKNKGSALTQSVLVLSGSLTVVMMIPIFLKLAHFSLIPEQAVRYLAWQEVFGLKQGQEKNFIIDHVLHNKSKPIQSQPDTSQRSNRSVWQSSYTYNGSQAFFSNTADDIEVTRRDDDLTKGVRLMNIIEKQNKKLFKHISGSKFNEHYDGLIVQEVSFESDTLGLLNEKLQFNARHALISDPWDSANPEEVKNNVNTFMPWARSKVLTDILSNIGYVPIFEDLRSLNGSSTHVATEVQRKDRLGPRQ